VYRKVFIGLGHKVSNKEVHSWIKQRFQIESTTKLTTIEWEEFIIKLQAYASNILGVQIPDPNEVILEQYLND
jgi:anthranilate/para-aminobenzoate synthase component II